MLNDIIIIMIFAILYRIGGWFFKPARRYGIPILGLIITGFSPMSVISMMLLCLIFHFNLNEIGEKDWDDVACYGFAQAYCLVYSAAFYAGILGIVWFVGTYLSNNKIGKLPKIDWMYVELAQGAAIGSCFTLLKY